ncbi:MAG TPA: hypothetical protein VLD63_01575 [Anaerolineales bacterium]|nr:hypothetical protein [Anaerolineales bacterium]
MAGLLHHGPYGVAAIGDLENPLPANPGGEEALAAGRADWVGWIYRATPEGVLPGLGRGRWEDDSTFVVDYSTFPNLEHYTIGLTFQDERLVLSIAEHVYGMKASIRGVAQP